ncbi:cell division suppressor protein YneA [Bacillus pinisoli]|uniref:cell division suppressor protein YneA n=1 Tax=Bacillus pinisoli TaxID=2901866 RepID=UPI001FF4173D|nr:hypothetical protein [Bacillus pinisoli]
MSIKPMNLSFYIVFIMSISVFFILAYFLSDNRIEENYAQVVITENQSIWELAIQFSSEHSLTPSEFVHWVEKNNSIDPDFVKAGTAITIPVKKELEDDSMFLLADGGTN